MLHITLQTELSLKELESLGFSMDKEAEKGWIYRVQREDMPIEDEDGEELDLYDIDNDIIIEAIKNKLYNSEVEEKYTFIADLMNELK